MGNLTVASLDDGIHGTMENGEPWEWDVVPEDERNSKMRFSQKPYPS